MRLAWGSSVGLAAAVLFGVWPLAGGDLWMHLIVGGWIWANAAILRVDVFSYVSEGQEFIAHSWLTELTFYGLEQSAGVAGFMVLWTEIEKELRRFEGPDGFVGPCELLVGAARR